MQIEKPEENKATEDTFSKTLGKLAGDKDAISFPDFPYDLNNLFNLQYSFDTIKEAIEYLAKQQAKMGNKMNALDSGKDK